MLVLEFAFHEVTGLQPKKPLEKKRFDDETLTQVFSWEFWQDLQSSISLKQPPEVFYRIGNIKNTRVGVFIKKNFIKNRLQHRYLLANFVKFLRIVFLQNTSRRLFWTPPGFCLRLSIFFFFFLFVSLKMRCKHRITCNCAILLLYHVKLWEVSNLNTVFGKYVMMM